MDIIKTPEYSEMQAIYMSMFSLHWFGNDISNKFALISLICYLKYKLSAKKPDVTHYQIIMKCGGENLPEDVVKALAVICSDFGYGCTEFPLFGLKDKQIPNKIKELLQNYLPF